MNSLIFNIYKVFISKVTHNLTYNLIQNKKHRETSFPKEILENADLNRPVLNKMMTTQE